MLMYEYVPRSLEGDELPPLLRAAESEPGYPEAAIWRQSLLGRQHRQRRRHDCRVCGVGALFDDVVGVVREVVEVLAEGDEGVALPGARQGLQVVLVHLCNDFSIVPLSISY